MNRLAIIFLSITVILISCNKDEPEITGSIAGNHVTAIYIDENGIRWFGTDNGISSYDGNVWKNYSDNDGLPCNCISDIDARQIETESQLMVGTSQGVGLVNKALNVIHSITSLTSSNSGLRSNRILTLAQDKVGGSWFGTDDGLSVQFGNNWLIGDKDSLVKEFEITDIAAGPDTISYVCFYGRGIALMDLDVDALTTVTYYEHPLSPLPSMNVQAIFVDGYNYQWIGTDNGLAFHGNFDPSKEWQLYYESDGLINKNVLSLKSDGDGITWIGTIAGVSRFDGEEFINYTSVDGLAGDTVYCIAIDPDGSAWFGTNNGASHLQGDVWTTYRED